MESTVTQCMTPGDNRINPCDINSYSLVNVHKAKSLNRSVAALFADKMLGHSNGSYCIKDLKSMSDHGVSCSEKFSKEPLAAFGTAFLISDELMLTAAHCLCPHNSNKIDPTYLKTIRIVFGYEMLNATDCRTSFKESDVYTIKKVIAHKFEGVRAEGQQAVITNRVLWNRAGNIDEFFIHLIKSEEYEIDWALIKLDRKASSGIPLELDFTDSLQRGSPVILCGFPLGLPLKLALKGYVKVAQQANSFGIEIDSFCGNSGSPLFDEKTNKVIGILVAGPNDTIFEQDPSDTSKKKLRHYKEHELMTRWHIVKKIAALPFVKLHLASKRDIKSKIELAEWHLTVKKDESKAIRILQKAARSRVHWFGCLPYWYSFGDSGAQCRMASLQQRQRLLATVHERAQLQAAERQKYKDAMYYYLYETSDNIEAKEKYNLTVSVYNLTEFYNLWNGHYWDFDHALNEHIQRYAIDTSKEEMRQHLKRSMGLVA